MEFPPVSHLFSWPDVLFEGTPFAVNKTILLVVAIGILLSIFWVVAGRKRALVPTGVQNLGEIAYGVVEENVTESIMGSEGKGWTPFFTTLFYWIFLLNVCGILPFILFPPSSRIAIPLFLALQTYLIMLVVGFWKQGPRYITNAIFPPGVPKVLYVLVAPLEFVSTFIVRPFSLGIRLFANLMAGHVLIAVFTIMTASLWATELYAVLVPLPFLMSIFMIGFELLVAVLQAYIFTVLTAVYIQEALHPAH